MKIAFIGLGNMGAPQARLLARAGHELAVHDVHAAARDAFAGIARVAGSAGDAAHKAEIACVCVRDDQQVEEVVLGANGLVGALAPGTLILIHSTIRITTLQELQAQLMPRGIALVDAPVSRTRRTDDEAFVFTMLGGDDREVQRARAIVEVFSTDLDHLGPLGAGMAAKIANNLVTWTHLVVGFQAAALASRHGVPYEKLRRIMTANGNLTPAVGAMLDGKLKAMPNGDPAHRQLLASQAGIGEKDLALAIDCARAAGVDIDMMTKTRELVHGVMTGTLPRPAQGDGQRPIVG